MDESNTVWPKDFMNIGSRTFEWTYANKAEFVDFTLTEMKKPTKMFLRWYNYCVSKTKDNDKSPEGFGVGKN